MLKNANSKVMLQMIIHFKRKDTHLNSYVKSLTFVQELIPSKLFIESVPSYQWLFTNSSKKEDSSMSIHH